jgi:hypothetical protein
MPIVAEVSNREDRMGRPKTRATRTRRKRGATASEDANARALGLIKASGILKPNVKLDAILKASEQLGLDDEAARPKGFHTFMFREFIVTKKPF